MTSNFQSKSFENLKSIKLSESPKLIEAPGIIEVPNLKITLTLNQLFSMHKPMMHNMLIRVTTGESQGKCVQSWRDGKCC
ncbi:hypothetical protein CMV_005071 [Castanea mollissima]|uniref:Uncharacterized protein n=1 Tax=Castanea mollissima TaxID=60419 RepID=A0A8J4RRM7_9ROSI|nr:hypothetical protein CMV_005071 [Castanea mollissima]